MRRGWIAAVAAIMTMAGCGSSDPAATATIAGPTAISVSEAKSFREGRDYRVAVDVPEEIGGQPVVYAGSARDGRQVLVLGGDALVSRDPDSGAIKVLSDRPRHQPEGDPGMIPGNDLQIGGAVVSADRVVWMESSTLAYADLHSYDLTTGTERLLVSSRDFGDGPGPWPAVERSPVVIDDDVYFLGFRKGDAATGLGSRRALFQVPVDGGPPKRVRTASLARACALGEAGVRVTCEETRLMVDSPVYGSFEIEAKISPAWVTVGAKWVQFTTESGDGKQRAYLLDLTRGRLMSYEAWSIDLARISLIG